jgi:hypothetical protein
MRHTANHDYYSFGLLLVEIGIWDHIPNLLKSHIQRKGPAGIQEKLIKHMEDKLSHSMGEAYEQATMTCLEAKLASEVEGAGMMQNVVKRFEHRVLEALEANPTIQDGRGKW